MKVKTSELTGAALNWAVSKTLTMVNSANGFMLKNGIPYVLMGDNWQAAEFSCNAAQAWPIIDSEGITTVCCEGEWNSKTGYSKFWIAEIGMQCKGQIYGSQDDYVGTYYSIYEDAMQGPTSLIAAMRCFVASKLGEEVDIPDELL